MGVFCKMCGMVMKHPKLSHCSYECLLADKKETQSLRKDDTDAESWKDELGVWR